MTTQVEWHEEATREHGLHIGYYLEEAGPDVAVRFVEAIDDAVAHIVEAPTRWRRLDERGQRDGPQLVAALTFPLANTSDQRVRPVSCISTNSVSVASTATVSPVSPSQKCARPKPTK